MITQHYTLNSKLIIYFAMLYAAISITAAVTAYKFVEFGAASISGATIIFPLNSLLCIVITEIYGYNTTKKIIWMGLFCEFLFALLVTLVIHLPSPSFWNLQNDFNNVLGSSLRFVASGTLADLIGMFSSAYFVSKWKILMRGKNFWLRGVVSAIISDFFMTIVIGVSAFTGKVSSHNLFLILIHGYLLHVIYAILLIWPICISAIILKRIEKIDVYDININYNPFYFTKKKENIYEINKQFSDNGG